METNPELINNKKMWYNKSVQKVQYTVEVFHILQFGVSPSEFEELCVFFSPELPFCIEVRQPYKEKLIAEESKINIYTHNESK